MGAERGNLLSLGTGVRRGFWGRPVCVGPRSTKTSPGEVGEGVQGGQHYMDKGPAPEPRKDVTCPGVAEQTGPGEEP